MKKVDKKNRTKGFAPLILFCGVALIVGIGIFVFSRIQSNSDAEEASQTANTSSAEAPATINGEGDLDKTQQSVEGTSVDSDLDTTQLDQDANSLL